MKENSIEEAIERLNRFKTIKIMYGNIFSMHLEQLKQLQEDLETALTYIVTLEKENEELIEIIARKNGYTQSLEEDLFGNASNYVISKQKIKDKIEELKQKQTDYGPFKNFDIESRISIIQELLENEEKQC